MNSLLGFALFIIICFRLKMSPRAGLDEKMSSLETETVPVDSLGLAPIVAEQPEQEVKRPPLQIVWRNVVLMVALHTSAIYGLYLLPQAKLKTLVWSKYLNLTKFVFLIKEQREKVLVVDIY
jgi:hypothetical protein